MPRKRSYVEAMENGEIELNQNSNNVTRIESLSELNDSEVFIDSNSEINSTVYPDEVSLNDESYVESVNEYLISSQQEDKENVSECDSEENSKFKKYQNSDEYNNIQPEDLNTQESDVVNLSIIPKQDNYSQTNQFEMSSVKNNESNTSSKESADQCLTLRRNTYPVSSERLLTLEKENLDEYGQAIDNKIDILNSVDEYVVASTIERFSNNFVDDSKFPFGDDLPRYEVIEVDQEIGDHTNTNTSSFQNNATSEETYAFPIQYTGRNSVRKSKWNHPKNHGLRAQKWRRVIFRNGTVNITSMLHLPGRAEKYLKDLVTTLVDGQWRWLIFLLSFCHFAIWIVFALLFYVASYANGDMSDQPPAIPCITEGRTFTGIFTFPWKHRWVSIGYGEKSPTDACPEVIFILVMEVVTGYLLLSGLVGVVYTKIVRPEKHLGGVGFSEKAVVCLRDGRLCLVVRVWDREQKHVMSTRLSGWFVKHTPEGLVNYPLKFPPGVMILWPVTLEHVIDKDSPLFDMSAKDLLDKRFEIIIAVTGACRLTGNMTQSRTSYLPKHVLWGHRFKRVLEYCTSQNSFIVDTKLLNSVESVDTPLCSARLLYELNSGIINGSPSISISPMYLSPQQSSTGLPPSIHHGPIMRFQNKLIREKTL